jgi:hypothetical protein
MLLHQETRIAMAMQMHLTDGQMSQLGPAIPVIVILLGAYHSHGQVAMVIEPSLLGTDELDLRTFRALELSEL